MYNAIQINSFAKKKNMRGRYTNIDIEIHPEGNTSQHIAFQKMSFETL